MFVSEIISNSILIRDHDPVVDEPQECGYRRADIPMLVALQLFFLSSVAEPTADRKGINALAGSTQKNSSVNTPSELLYCGACWSLHLKQSVSSSLGYGGKEEKLQRHQHGYICPSISALLRLIHNRIVISH